MEVDNRTKLAIRDSLIALVVMAGVFGVMMGIFKGLASTNHLPELRPKECPAGMRLLGERHGGQTFSCVRETLHERETVIIDRTRPEEEDYWSIVYYDR